MYAVDLRGHGDSAWAIGGQYSLPEFVLDVAMLVRELDRSPLTIIGHSLGGAVALEYAGVFPETVLKVVAVEGLGRARRADARLRPHAPLDRRDAGLRCAAQPRRYRSLGAAEKRMREENPHLTRRWRIT